MRPFAIVSCFLDQQLTTGDLSAVTLLFSAADVKKDEGSSLVKEIEKDFIYLLQAYAVFAAGARIGWL